MNDPLKIKEKVKQRYGKVVLTDGSYCGASVSFEDEGGCRSGTNNAAGIGRMVISDLVTDKQIAEDPLSIDPVRWCSCIDGALTKENHIASIKKGGFGTVEMLDEKLHLVSEGLRDFFS